MKDGAVRIRIDDPSGWRSGTRVLHVTNIYPTTEEPVFGVFVRDQIDDISRRARERGIAIAVAVIRSRGMGNRAYLGALRDAGLRLLLDEAHLIHAHHLITAGLLSLKGGRKPLVVSYMNQRGAQLKGAWHLMEGSLERIVTRRASTIIHKGEIPSGNGAEGDPGLRRVFLPNGVDMEAFRPLDRAACRRELGIPEEAIVPLFVSANSLDRPGKRYDLFCRIVDVMRERARVPVWPVAIVNEPRERLPVLYNAADVQLVCSDHEGSPNAVKEVLSCNVPVVSRDVGTLRWLLSGVDGCAVLDSDDPRMLADAVMTTALVAGRIDGRGRLRTLGLDRARVSDRLLDEYELLLRT